MPEQRRSWGQDCIKACLITLTGYNLWVAYVAYRIIGLSPEALLVVIPIPALAAAACVAAISHRSLTCPAMICTGLIHITSLFLLLIGAGLSNSVFSMWLPYAALTTALNGMSLATVLAARNR